MMDTDNKQVQPAEYLELAQRYVAGDQSVAPQLRALVHQQAKQWMGDKAQIVDAAGEPRVVYHGTPNEFNAFSHDYMGICFILRDSCKKVQRQEETKLLATLNYQLSKDLYSVTIFK